MTKTRQCLAAVSLIVLGFALMLVGAGISLMGNENPDWVRRLSYWMMPSSLYVGASGVLWLVWLIAKTLKDKFSQPPRPPA